MSNYLTLNQSQTIAGLGTWNYTIPAAGPYFIQFQFSEVPPSSLVLTINVNGSPVYTSTTLAAQQSAAGAKVDLNSATNDAITVVLSSSAPIDKQLNTVQTTIAIGQGA
jgi:hypothetical protein